MYFREWEFDRKSGFCTIKPIVSILDMDMEKVITLQKILHSMYIPKIR